jgi:catechol 2,3-dioxygenase-like lactoylglutathione lyase family enzyme
MTRYLHTMVRVTDPERSRAFYEALGMEFRRDLDIVRDGELEATNYFFGFPGQEEELELTSITTAALTTSAPATGTWRSASTTSTGRSRGWRSRGSSPSARRTPSARAAIGSASSVIRMVTG